MTKCTQCCCVWSVGTTEKYSTIFFSFYYAIIYTVNGFNPLLFPFLFYLVDICAIDNKKTTQSCWVVGWLIHFRLFCYRMKSAFYTHNFNLMRSTEPKIDQMCNSTSCSISLIKCKNGETVNQACSSTFCTLLASVHICLVLTLYSLKKYFHHLILQKNRKCHPLE